MSFQKTTSSHMRKSELKELDYSNSLFFGLAPTYVIADHSRTFAKKAKVRIHSAQRTFTSDNSPCQIIARATRPAQLFSTLITIYKVVAATVRNGSFVLQLTLFGEKYVTCSWVIVHLYLYLLQVWHQPSVSQATENGVEKAAGKLE